MILDTIQVYNCNVLNLLFYNLLQHIKSVSKTSGDTFINFSDAIICFLLCCLRLKFIFCTFYHKSSKITILCAFRTGAYIFRTVFVTSPLDID